MYSRLRVLVALVLVLAVAVVVAPVAANDAASGSAVLARQGGSVTGEVLLDGNPLAGVEVWIGEFGSGGLAASHYACTDASGEFTISGVSLSTDLRAAVGIEVNHAQPCSNPLYLDLSHAPRGLPLLTQYWNGKNAEAPGDSFTLDSSETSQHLEFNVVPWPIADQPVLINTLLNAIEQFHDGRPDQAIRRAEHFRRQVDRLERRGTLSAAEADDLRDYTDNLINEIFPITVLP